MEIMPRAAQQQHHWLTKRERGQSQESLQSATVFVDKVLHFDNEEQPNIQH
jgi:hypothetical protein